MEQTLVIVKPDGYERGLTGEIISRIERTGLRIIDIRVSRNEKARVDQHYPRDDDWLRIVGQKTLSDYEERGISANASLGTSDPLLIGTMIRGWLTDYMLSGPLVAMVVEGNRAVGVVRRLIGSTIPATAQTGTVRGDFSCDSPDVANAEARPVKNLVHASGDKDEAQREIGLWFGGQND